MKPDNLILIGAIGIGIWYFFIRKPKPKILDKCKQDLKEAIDKFEGQSLSEDVGLAHCPQDPEIKFSGSGTILNYLVNTKGWKSGWKSTKYIRSRMVV